MPLEQIGVVVDPSAAIQFEELEHIITKCIENLPPRQKLVATLAWCGQVRQAEIAARLGCTDENVSMLLKHAREKVRLAITARGVLS